MNAVRLLLLVALLAWGGAGCGGGGDAADTSVAGGAEEAAQNDEVASAEDQVQAKTDAIAQDPNLSEEDKELLTQWATYQTVHDSDAVYTMDDLPDWGNYRKLNLSKLSPEQMNLVVHELKTNTCDCPGCGEEWPIDRCLVVKPECSRGLTMAQEIVGRIRVLGK